jgi:hypothetical protein
MLMLGIVTGVGHERVNAHARERLIECYTKWGMSGGRSAARHEVRQITLPPARLGASDRRALTVGANGLQASSRNVPNRSTASPARTIFTSADARWEPW